MFCYSKSNKRKNWKIKINLTVSIISILYSAVKVKKKKLFLNKIGKFLSSNIFELMQRMKISKETKSSFIASIIIQKVYIKNNNIKKFRDSEILKKKIFFTSTYFCEHDLNMYFFLRINIELWLCKNVKRCHFFL